MELQSTITCPECGNSQRETMPDDRCVFFWECPDCNEVIRPKKGDCCVFCSYGDEDCPPKMNSNCC